MPTFICYLNWTDQGVRNIRDAKYRQEAGKAVLKSLGGEVKHDYITTGQYAVVRIADAPDADAMKKFALALGEQGNVRTTTVRAYPEEEFNNIISEVPDWQTPPAG
jgi:uncharacterized protein with GYD domain